MGPAPGIPHAGGRAPEPRGRVVVAEDDPVTARALERLLGERFDVVRAGDGLEALEHVAEALPACVVTDVVMPRCSGDELLVRLRADPALRKVPVIVITSSADTGLHARLLGLGAHDVLRKPFAERELLASVTGVVDRERRRRLATAPR